MSAPPGSLTGLDGWQAQTQDAMGGTQGAMGGTQDAMGRNKPLSTGRWGTRQPG